MNNGKTTLNNYNIRSENPYKVRPAGILFALHVALTPIHQALLTSSGSTINKYLVLLIMGVMLLEMVLTRKPKLVRMPLIQALLPFALWIGMTFLWSDARSNTLSSLMTIYPHIILLLMCSAYSFSKREKKMIRYALIIASVYYALTLVTEMISGEDMRATISVGMNDAESDENLLSANIGIAVLIAFDNLKKERKLWLKTLNIIAIIITLLGMFSTGSRGGLIATLIPLVYLLLKHYPKRSPKKIAFVVLGLLFAVYLMSDYSILSDYILERYNNQEAYSGGSGRTGIWLQYLEIMTHRPYMFLMGNGFGAEAAAYKSHFETNWPPATHNDYVTLLVSSGILGLLFIGYFVRYCWIKAKKNKNYLTGACIISALITAMSLNVITRYGFWNVLIFALIGI